MAPTGSTSLSQKNRKTNSVSEKDLPLKKRSYSIIYADQSNKDSKFKIIAKNKDKGARSNHASNTKIIIRNKDKAILTQNNQASNMKRIEARNVQRHQSKTVERNRASSGSVKEQNKKTCSLNSPRIAMPVQPFTAVLDQSFKGGYTLSAAVNRQDMRGVVLSGPASHGIPKKKRVTKTKPKTNPTPIVAASSSVPVAEPVVAHPSEPKGKYFCNCGRNRKPYLKIN